jgi:hypothetical protein
MLQSRGAGTRQWRAASPSSRSLCGSYLRILAFLLWRECHRSRHDSVPTLCLDVSAAFGSSNRRMNFAAIRSRSIRTERRELFAATLLGGRVHAEE